MLFYKHQWIISTLFIIALIFTTSCMIEINSSTTNSLSINWVLIDYDQIDKKLFLKLNIDANEEINSVSVNVMGETPLMDITLTLLDDGNNGDLISQNNIYSIEENNMDLPYQENQLEAIVISSELVEYKESITVNIEEQVPPEIINMTFSKINQDGSEIPLDPMTDYFQVNEEEFSYLYFSVEVKDVNGIEDIRYVRYQINVENMEAEDSCDYVAPLGFQNYSQWYLEYKNKTDSTYIFDIVNDFLVDDDNNPVPGLPIKPLSLCGRTGISAFKFVIADMIFSPITTEPIYLVFEK